MMKTAPSSPSPSATRERVNPFLDADGWPHPRVPERIAYLLEGRVRDLPYFLLVAFIVAAVGTGLVAALVQLTGESVVGGLVLVWLIVAVAAFFAWTTPSVSLIRFGWLVLTAVVLTVVSQLARGADGTIETIGSVLGAALLTGVSASVIIAFSRAWENRATGGARRVAWALELVALLAAGAAFAWFLPFSLLVSAGVLVLIALLLVPEALALARGVERVGRADRFSVPDPSRAASPGRGHTEAVPDAGPRALPADLPADEHEADRVQERPVVKSEDFADLLLELESFPGLTAVKKQVRELAAFLRVQSAREEKGLKRASASAHLRFEGAPGTGKTEMARLIARILAALGVVEHGHLVEVSRSKLVGKYQGHTADAVRAMCDQAQGGVLFVDEAYALFSGEQDNFGTEAVTELLRRMENDREGFVVILAGYSREMAKLMNSNPGLRSRVQRIITFPEYEPTELLEIAERFAFNAEYDYDDEATTELQQTLTTLYEQRDEKWGNAREVRSLYEAMTRAHAERMTDGASKAELRTLTAEDVRAALRQYRIEHEADRAGQRQAEPVSPFTSL